MELSYNKNVFKYYATLCLFYLTKLHNIIQEKDNYTMHNYKFIDILYNSFLLNLHTDIMIIETKTVLIKLTL